MLSCHCYSSNKYSSSIEVVVVCSFYSEANSSFKLSGRTGFVHVLVAIMGKWVGRCSKKINIKKCREEQGEKKKKKKKEKMHDFFSSEIYA